MARVSPGFKAEYLGSSIDVRRTSVGASKRFRLLIKNEVVAVGDCAPGQTITLRGEVTASAIKRRVGVEIKQEQEQTTYRLVVDDLPADLPLAIAPEIEAKIAEDPDNREPYLVYADWLQSQGDPRGELMAVETSLPGSGERFEELWARRGEILSAHEEAWIGDAYAWIERPEWNFGFLRGVRVLDEPRATGRGQTLDRKTALQQLFARPVARFLTELDVTRFPRRRKQSGDIVELLVELKPPQLRRLSILHALQRHHWKKPGAIEPIYATFPKLVSLRLHGDGFDLGRIEHDRLQQFSIYSDYPTKASLKAVLTARWPQLEELSIRIGSVGSECSLDDVLPLFDLKLPHLKTLYLTSVPAINQFIPLLAQSPLAEQIEWLGLVDSEMTGTGVELLQRHRDSFKKLERLTVDENWLSEKAVKELEGYCSWVDSNSQRR